MTVKELIKELKKLNQNADVEIVNTNLTENYHGEMVWESSGTRELYKVVETKSKYNENRTIVVLG